MQSSLLKRISLITLSTVLAFSTVGCSRKSKEEEQKAFRSFMNKEFTTAMQEEYIAFRTYIDDPKPYKIDASKIKVGLGTRSDLKSMKKVEKKVKKSFEQFEDFDRDLLTKKQQDEYDAYAYSTALDLEMASDEYEYYDQLFSTMSGLHTQLPTLFSDWEMEDDQDVVDLIVCIADTKDYVNSALTYTIQQNKKGLFMSDIDGVIEYCKGIVSKGENSPILASINEHIDAIASENASMYKEQVKNAFQTSLIPAYKEIIKVMEEIKEQDDYNKEGYAKFKHGKSYYELLVQSKIGSHKSVSDVKAMMEEAYGDYLRKLTKVVMTHPKETEPIVSMNLPKTGYQNYNEILEDLKKEIQKEYPSVKDLEYNIIDMNKEIASDGVSAYFSIPKLGNHQVKQMRVNPNMNDVSSISTYSTIAHEGFPGHMYQYAYMYENVDSNYIKALSDVIAYTEGYAVYAQMNSLKYLKNKKISGPLLEVYRLNELASYAVIILADIGIHYEGWTLDDFVAFLRERGFNLTDKEAQQQYKQLQANPAAFMPYYVGYAEFDALRNDAKEQLGEKYNEKKFNQAILEAGCVPFEVVKRHVDAYIEKTNK